MEKWHNCSSGALAAGGIAILDQDNSLEHNMTQSHSQDSRSALTDAEKAALFQELLQQMAGDKVTLLWNSRDSLSGDELVSHLQDAHAKRQARDKEVAAPAAPADTSVQAYQFEAIGFLKQRSDFERLESKTSDAMAQSLFAAIAPKLAEFGFIGLEEAYVTEDDEQRDSDIKCFVCVRLLGHSNIEENDVPPQALADMMAGISAAVCCASDGTWMLHPEDWELASINDPEEPAA